MTKRLTVSGATSQRDIDRLMELSNENQFGRNEAYYKLQCYEEYGFDYDILIGMRGLKTGECRCLNCGQAIELEAE